MHATLEPLIDIIDLNTDLLLNCCAGVGEDEARRRLEGGGNSLVFLAAHLADARHYLAKGIGAPLENPLEGTLAHAKSIDDVVEMPALADILAAWKRVSRHLSGALAGLTEADCRREIANPFPIAGDDLLTMITFLVQHDTYHVGQMAFLRRQLGHAAMAYERRDDSETE